MNVVFVQVLKVRNFPKYTNSTYCGYRVFVGLWPKDEGSYGTLNYIQKNEQEVNKDDYLTSQVTWNFQYDDANSTSVRFLFYYDDFHFASLKLPLFWFQKNTVVTYSFPARLQQNTPMSQEAMMVKIAIHLSENKEAAFAAPKGSLLVTPKWKTSKSQNTLQHPQQPYYPSSNYPPPQQIPQQYNNAVLQPVPSPPSIYKIGRAHV